LIILIILGEEYKSRSSSLCSFLHSPVTSSLFGPNKSAVTALNIVLASAHIQTTSLSYQTTDDCEDTWQMICLPDS
jgi:hypothetical protein